MGGIFSAFSSMPFRSFFDNAPRREMTEAESSSLVGAFRVEEGSRVDIVDGLEAEIDAFSSITISNSVIASRAKSIKFLLDAWGKTERGWVSKTANTPMVCPSNVTIGAPA